MHGRHEIRMISAPTENERTVTGMDEYIKREALIEWLKCIPLIDLSDGHGLCRVIMEGDFKKAIKKMPKGIIADVSPVRHGRWERDEWGSYLRRCSVCKKSPVYQDERGNSVAVYAGVCINCGAKMEGGESQGMKR